jgi:hypothetical protein
MPKSRPHGELPFALPGNLQAGTPIVTMETQLAGSALEGSTM